MKPLPGPCMLCGRPGTDMVGGFIPDDPQAFGAPPGKRRIILYPLHDACRLVATRDMLAEVEERLRAEILPPNRN